MKEKDSFVKKVKGQRGTLEAYLERLDGADAEVFVYEDGTPQPYVISAGELRAIGIVEGERFLIEVVETDAGPTWSLRKKGPVELLAPSTHESAEDIRSRADWASGGM